MIAKQWARIVGMAALGLVLTTPAYAGGGRHGGSLQGGGRWASDVGGGYSLDDAAANVRRQSGGRVLSANPVQRGDRRAYRFKVLTPQGRVRTLFVNPASGRVEH